jgi:glyoxylase-like metal-dependent hydrolase (beta-lactamase superfamily II)
MKRVAILAALCAASVIPAFAQQPQQAPQQRNIVNITGQLYRVNNNTHATWFLVTPEGIIMGDPINRDMAEYLKTEFASRFKVPVRYVLYSHRDWDHATGGAVFADTAQFIGHVNMLPGLAAAATAPTGNVPLSGEAARLDKNGDGLLGRGEATGQIALMLPLLDFNGDNIVTGAEFIRGPLRDVHPPTTTFTDKHTVTLGGKTVNMSYVGTAHTDDGVVMHFPAERAIFAADVIQVKRLPVSIPPSIGAWIDTLRTINAIDYDHALTGHALAGTKKDVVEFQSFLEELAQGVAAGIGAGQSLAEIQKSLQLEKYKHIERWSTHRAPFIASVYATIKGTPQNPAAATR